jgi:ferredoxin
MVLDPATVSRGLDGAEVIPVRHLCGPELATFQATAASGETIVACTAMRSLFEAVRTDQSLGGAVQYANVRETAGWSRAGAAAAPKMAALLAAAALPAEPPVITTSQSNGVTLILGRDGAAIAVAEALQDQLDLTVLLVPGAAVTPPRDPVFPVRQGRARVLKGHLGAFEVTIDAYASPRPSSRASYTFGAARDGAVSKADIVIDLTGGSLLTAPDLRDGYLRADPADPAAVERLIRRAADLVGTFDKPRAIKFRADLCAHARSKKVGCRRCLDLCPAGAISPAGNAVAIDPGICAGCGQCAAACPTGAASYALPPVDRSIARLRAMLAAWRKAGGGAVTLLVHDTRSGADLIDAAARFGDGLRADVLPFAVEEVTAVGLETIAAALAYGATAVRVLTPARPKHDVAGLVATLTLGTRIASGLGHPDGVVSLLQLDDPDALTAALASGPADRPLATPANFLPVGGKRDLLTRALREWQRVAPAPVDVIALPKGAPMGRVNVVDGCTLCLSCVSACPTRALSDAQDRPRLAFDESLCVQCGLCVATCPEQVMALEPRIAFTAFEAAPIVLREEEPFCCVSCGKAFGVKSTIERVVKTLEDKHWMFSGANRARVDMIRMCDDCRVSASMNQGLDPFAGPARPAAKTSEDYLREREAKMREKIDKGEA